MYSYGRSASRYKPQDSQIWVSEEAGYVKRVVAVELNMGFDNPSESFSVISLGDLNSASYGIFKQNIPYCNNVSEPTIFL